MGIAVISDMQGNDFAFQSGESVIQKQSVYQIICLSDAIQGGPQPAAVVQRLLRLNCPIVMGNADAWLLSGLETGNEEIPPERLKKMDAIRLWRSEEHTSELQSLTNLVCRLLLEKKKRS